MLPKMEWQRNKRNRPIIDEGNYDKYGEKENILAKERFSQQRLGNESARQETELAVDVFNAKGRHKAVAEIRKSFAGFPIDSGWGTPGHGIYDDRGLTLAANLSPRRALEPLKNSGMYSSSPPPPFLRYLS